VPAPGFSDLDAMADWLRTELGFEVHQVVLRKRQPAQAVTWAGRDVAQPERWTVNLQSPARGVVAEYFVGNRFVKLEQADATLFGVLTQLHMSVGVGAFWVLLADTAVTSMAALGAALVWMGL
jgi:uncharacterized protein